ncbi:MAG: prepilin peptidase [Promicromonosporaceae bacterium]|nr:prepilin peptidase [Promicromonosporaceae bacterium]
MAAGLTLLLVAVALLGVEDVGLRGGLVVLSPLAAALAVADARTYRIPTRLTIASGAVANGTCVLLAILGNTWTPLVAGPAAGILVGVVFLALWRFTGLGLGDVRLAAALAPMAGAAGWQAVVAFVVAAHLLAVPLALWALARGRRDIPFGPPIVAGVYVAIALGPLL